MLKFLLVIAAIALVVYLCARVLDAQLGGPQLKRPQRRGPQAPRRPLGPDDDPEFLRQLNRRRPPGREPKRED